MKFRFVEILFSRDDDENLVENEVDGDKNDLHEVG